MQAESRKSLVRRFSARYTVQWDYPGDLKKLFSSPVGNTSVRKSSKDEGATHIISEDGSSQVKEIEEVRDSSGQVCMGALYRLIIKPCHPFSNRNMIKISLKNIRIDSKWKVIFLSIIPYVGHVSVSIAESR